MAPHRRGVIKLRDRYTARIWIDRELIDLGSFDTIDEASAAYLAAKSIRDPKALPAVPNDRDFILLDVHLLWQAASEHLAAALRCNSDASSVAPHAIPATQLSPLTRSTT
jgi:hypothetical protein